MAKESQGERHRRKEMPLKDAIAAQNRLRKDTIPLTEAELPDFFPHLNRLDERDVRILWGHVSLLMMQVLHRNRGAIEQFEVSSSKWTKWLTGLTVTIAIETLVLIWLTWKMV
jgi:hypothetical protein